jgi:hypothetical protein
VRVGALYALERLSESYPEYRQAIVNVICGYLRMPFDPPPRRDPEALFSPPPRRDPGALFQRMKNSARYAAASDRLSATVDSKRELEVRLTAQQILSSRLSNRPDISPAHQGPHDAGALDIDLRGATLVDFNLSSCIVKSAHFEGAQFVGMAFIEDSTFREQTHLDWSRFEKLVYFTGSRFERGAWFDGAVFEDAAWLNQVYFGDHVRFPQVRFGDYAFFGGSTFQGMAWFEGARFEGSFSFEDAVIENRRENPIDKFYLGGSLVIGAEQAKKAELPPGWVLRRVSSGIRGTRYVPSPDLSSALAGLEGRAGSVVRR